MLNETSKHIPGLVVSYSEALRWFQRRAIWLWDP